MPTKRRPGVRSTRAWTVLSLLVSAGCGAPVERNDPVALEKVPPLVLKKAQEALPGVRFERAWHEVENGQEVYELRGRNTRGQTHEIEVTPAGQVLDRE